ASPKQLIKDDESRAMVTMSRKKQRLYEAMQISKERKRANVDTLEKRKKNLKKNKETCSHWNYSQILLSFLWHTVFVTIYGKASNLLPLQSMHLQSTVLYSFEELNANSE
ncbi:hypothetical protein Tco_0855731, partial [Tanacetum coccineum]